MTKPWSKSSKAEEEYDRWSKEIKRGAASLAILSVLERQPNYGYEIVKQLSKLAGSLMKLEQGTVYPLLRRLEQRGILQSVWNYDDPTKPRKYYQVTAEGKAALRLMIDTWSVLSQEMQNIIQEESQ
ncbi:MAG: helix-turn-helix transcriptional regulator [Anaerolineales bacterium]|nr:helix-turn-helix transcriptional regulator [Anaerolineales bacterium]